ncbi:MAG: PAS domain S-box protein [wastewater metagenome]|nr:PAS domain S-box protein [Candidatus Loosdrechtia aerotolerans]
MSERIYRLSLENVPLRIFYKNRRLVYVYCNENLARDLHIRPDGIRGKTDFDFYPVALAEKYRTDDKKVMRSGQIAETEDKHVKDGKEFVIQMIRTPVRDLKGNVIGVFGSFWNITEKVILIMESLQDEYQVLLDELAAGMGHEINNPVTGIINCAQILFNKSSEGSWERDLARRIIEEGNFIANTVHTLFACSRLRGTK